MTRCISNLVRVAYSQATQIVQTPYSSGKQLLQAFLALSTTDFNLGVCPFHEFLLFITSMISSVVASCDSKD